MTLKSNTRYDKRLQARIYLNFNFIITIHAICT